MVLYAWISGKIKGYKKRKNREKTIPYVADNISVGKKYDVHLNNGRTFNSVEIVGTTQADEGSFSFTGWDELLVLKRDNGNRIFLKQSAIRFIEEV